MANRGFDIRKLTGFSSIAMACFFMLYMPIILLVVYSFNAGTSIAIWEGFSWRWYVSAWDNEMVQEATVRSLIIAVSAAAISTSVAVLAALGTTRTGKFRGQTAVFALIHQPLMVPEIVTAVALLIFFASIKVVTGYTGLMYLIIAHSAFC
ncbi:MAG TPA: spermidine/putrescine ABC transporter permease PotC, partial [Sulfitobacter sp.]|nr:spermidine/putrescine ABC transporter permease PotC [Sulfitobacter sp.]